MPQPGERLRDYEIVAELDSGGMAVLYLARELGPGDFRRPVAIKVLRPRLLAADPSVARMFMDEARISARIEHPNVVHVEELGEHGDTYFLVMEYIAGCSLLELLRALARRGRGLSPGLAVWIATRVAAGLHHAHEIRGEDGQRLGVIHRDINPRNILLGSDGQVKLIDFGIAKARDRLAKTTQGVVKGTLRYMSPEQARGRQLDRRTDVFSLGVVLWEMLVGRRLVRGRDDVEIARQLVDPSPLPPSVARSDLDRRLDEPVLRALARDPEQRYATAQDMRRALVEAAPRAAELDASALSALLWAVLPEELRRRTEQSFGDRAPPVPELDVATVVARSTWADPTLVDQPPVEDEDEQAAPTEVMPAPALAVGAQDADGRRPAPEPQGPADPSAAPATARAGGTQASPATAAPARAPRAQPAEATEPVRLPTRRGRWLAVAVLLAVLLAVALAVAL